MPIDQSELGRRIRQAREACGMTQEEVSDGWDFTPTVAQIELGNRVVSSLDSISWRTCLGETFVNFWLTSSPKNEVVRALFRSHREASEEGFNDALRECIALGKELTALKSSSEWIEPFLAWRHIFSFSEVEMGGYSVGSASGERRAPGRAWAGHRLPLAILFICSKGKASGPARPSFRMRFPASTISDSRIGLFVVNNRNTPRSSAAALLLVS